MTASTPRPPRLAAALLTRLLAPLLLLLLAGPFATGALAYPWPVWTPAIPAVPPSSTGATYYVDGTAGSNTNNGTSPGTAFKTIAKAVSMLAAGDTILIRMGLYREPINLIDAPSGTAAKPITVGSYGDGEVIVDGSTKVTGWTVHSGTVWKAPIAFTPIGIVVNEVPLRQVTQGQGGSTAPQVGLAGVTPGSGKWYRGGGFIYADMGTTLGAGDPNAADIVVPNNVGNQEHVFWYDQHYIRFKGLTVRGSGSNGIWGYGSNVTVESCNIKFNGKAAVSYLSAGGIANSDNAVITSHAYHNNLVNWPRGNNGFAEAGGGWPGTLVWDTNLRPLARGNIVHRNGGEGIISYGTAAGLPSGSALFEQNVAFDNWSVNMYFDNQPNNVARNNLLLNHPPDSADFLYVSASYPWDALDKFTVCLMLADEQNSSDATNGYANLRGSQVYNNVMAGCRIGIRDYSEGSQSVDNHGLKDTLITNNTIIMPFHTFTGGDTFGIYLQDNKTPSGTQRNTNSAIRNNVIYGFNSDKLFFTEIAGAQGITIDHNAYYSATAQPFGAGYNVVNYYNFAGWKAAITGADVNSVFADPLLVDVAHFRGPGTTEYDYAKAGLLPSSPARLAGTATGAPATDFRGAPRPSPAPSIGALEPFVAGAVRGDVDGDRNADLFWRQPPAGSGLSWWRMNGAATIAANYHEVGSEWQVGDVGDLDGDGKADLVWRRSTDGATYLWTLDGLGFKGFHDLGILDPAAWSLAGAADIDGDGKADLVWRAPDGTVYAWLMNGGAIAAQGVIGNPGAAWVIADLADMDGDGRSDIIFRNTTDGGVYIFLMNGLSIASGGFVGAVDPAAWVLVGAADLSGDGKGDLVWRHSSGDTWVWLMNGAAYQSAGGLGNPGVAWSIRAIGDLDGDGKVDLLWRHTDGTTYLWKMNGAAVSAYLPVNAPGPGWEVVAP